MSIFLGPSSGESWYVLLMLITCECILSEPRNVIEVLNSVMLLGCASMNRHLS